MIFHSLTFSRSRGKGVGLRTKGSLVRTPAGAHFVVALSKSHLPVDGRLTWTDCDEAGDYVVPYVLSPRDLVFRPDNMDETVPHKCCAQNVIDHNAHSYFHLMCSA